MTSFSGTIKQESVLPAIYVDLDDVLAKTTCRYVDVVKYEFGKTVDFENITSFNLQETFSLSDSEYEYFFKLVHEPEIILELEPIEDAIGVLNKWSKEGYEISIITGRLTSTYDSSLEWLNSNQVPFDSFIMVDKYSRPVVDKNIAITLDRFSKMDFVLAIEDSADMAYFISQRMNTDVIIFDRPWNRHATFPNGVQRCATWEEIAKIALNWI